MKNLKGIAVVTDGSIKRIAMTYDVINDEGVATAMNKRINRVVTDAEVLAAINVIEKNAKNIIDEQGE